MSADFTGGEPPTPDPPRLCPDHRPVIGNATHLDGLQQTAVANARGELARQCPQCYPLNPRRLR